MLGLLLIYFIWKKLAELASKYNRSRWGYGLLGIAVYFASQLLFGFIIWPLMLANGTELTDGTQLMVSFFAIAFGALGVYLLHYFLKNPGRSRECLYRIHSCSTISIDRCPY